MAARLKKNHPLEHDQQNPDVIGHCSCCGLEIFQVDIEDDWAYLVPGLGYLCDACEGQ